MAKIIAVLGGGHGGHAAAAELTLKGYECRLYQDAKFAKEMAAVFESHEIKISGDDRKPHIAEISVVTSSMQEAITGADIILIPVPAYVHRLFATQLADLVEEGQTIVLLPGTLGTLVFARIFRERGMLDKVTLAETNTLPYDTRILAPGEVYVYKMNDPLLLGVFPAEKTTDAMEKLAGLYQFSPVTDVLECALHSHNPVLHTPGCIMNTGRIERSRGEFWLYEEGFSPTVCRVTNALDQERMAIARAFGYEPLTLEQALSGKKEPDDLWKEVNGNRGLCFIKGPSHVNSRYFTEDTPYGLVPWSMIGDIAGVDTPLIDSFATIASVVIHFDSWKKGRTLKDMGIEGMSVERLKDYMQKGR